MTSESLNNTNIHDILSLLGYKALFVHFHFFSAILYIDICLGTGVIFQRKINQKNNYFISDFESFWVACL